MPIHYNSEVVEALRALEKYNLRHFVMEILRNGSFLKKAEHKGGGYFVTHLEIGVDIYFYKSGGEVNIHKIIKK